MEMLECVVLPTARGAGKEDEKTAGLVKKDGIAMNLRDHTIEEVWNSEHMRRTR